MAVTSAPSPRHPPDAYLAGRPRPSHLVCASPESRLPSTSCDENTPRLALAMCPRLAREDLGTSAPEHVHSTSLRTRFGSFSRVQTAGLRITAHGHSSNAWWDPGHMWSGGDEEGKISGTHGTKHAERNISVGHGMFCDLRNGRILGWQFVRLRSPVKV